MKARKNRHLGTRRLWRTVCPGVLLALAFGAAPARAAPSWLKKAFEPKGGAAAPIVARYRIDGGAGFVVDASGPRPLIKFDDNPEVFVLTASRGPRGDMIYLSDQGRPLLRTTKMGGVTVFTPERPSGLAATETGASAPLHLTSVGPTVLYHILLQSSARASRAARHLIGFEAPEADPTSDGLIADAAVVTSQAVLEMAAQPETRALLTRMDKVQIVRGQYASASLRGGTIVVMVNPGQGIAGRPSSRRIILAVGGR